VMDMDGGREVHALQVSPCSWQGGCCIPHKLPTCMMCWA
jgi:hypothetical protein